MITGKYVNKYYLKYIVYFLIGIAALIAVDYFQLIIPEIFGKTVDGLEDGSLTMETVKKYLLYFAGIGAIMFTGRFLWRVCIFGNGVRVEADMREKLFVHSERLSQSFYKEHKTGALMALYTNDLQTIRESFGMGTIMMVDAIFLGIMSFYKMWKLSYVLAICAIVPLAIIAVLSVFLGRIMEQKFGERQKAYEQMSDFTQENYSGIAVVKAFVKETNEVRRFAKINENNKEKNVDFAKLSTLLDVILTGVLSLIIAILIGGGSYLVIKDANFSIGDLLAYIAYFNTLIWPMMAFAELINMRAQAKASLKRVSELLDTKVDIVDSSDCKNFDTINGKIEFRHLNFKYPDGTSDTLKDICFTINAGETVGIIGKTGCGKTTVVDLLLRIYNLPKDELFLDDIDIMNLPFKKVRDAIGYVPQDNFLFSDTIKNNIGFAFNESTEEVIEKAAMMADVHSNIVEFNEKYETILGERGVTLSGGQKQRVSIARALLKNPNILIFDDSVSAVDTKTEDKILTNLKELRHGKTTIMIAHRISTVKELDKIILMDNGTVVAVGNHNELIKKSPLYAEMVRLQSLEQEIMEV